MNSIIIDHIDKGNMDRELGQIVRDPEYADYTAMEIKAVLTDRIADNMLPEHHYGLRWACRAVVSLLAALLVVAITYNVGG